MCAEKRKPQNREELRHRENVRDDERK